MKTKFIYIAGTVLMFLFTSPIIGQIRDDLRGPGAEPAEAPIDDYWWVLVLVALVFAIVKLKSFTKQTTPLQQ